MEVYPCLDQQNRPWPETLQTCFTINAAVSKHGVHSQVQYGIVG